MLNLWPVVRLFIVTDESNHRCISCKLYDRVRSINWHTVIGEEGIEEPAQHTVLGCTSVECDDGGAVVVQLDMLRSIGQKVHIPLHRTLLI